MEDDKILLDRHTQSLVRKYDLGGDSLRALADFFAALSDSTRLRIVSALSISEMCVTDLSRLLNINQTTVSHQLKNLRTIGVVGSYRQGKVIFYFVRNRAVLEILTGAADCI